jgi:hypothetical protein
MCVKVVGKAVPDARCTKFDTLRPSQSAELHRNYYLRPYFDGPARRFLHATAPKEQLYRNLSLVGTIEWALCRFPCILRFNLILRKSV